MSVIEAVHARQVLDSRGKPTVEASRAVNNVNGEIAARSAAAAADWPFWRYLGAGRNVTQGRTI
jgi:enolase